MKPEQAFGLAQRRTADPCIKAVTRSSSERRVASKRLAADRGTTAAQPGTRRAPADDRAAEATDLDAPLHPVHRVQIVGVAWMAGKLRRTGTQVTEDAQERGLLYTLRARFPILALPIEVAAIRDLCSAVPQRNSEPGGNLASDGPDRRPEVHVLVRIEMRGVCPKQTPEKLELSQRLASNLAEIVHVHGAIQLPPPAAVENPLAEVQMKSDSEFPDGLGRNGPPRSLRASAPGDWCSSRSLVRGPR